MEETRDATDAGALDATRAASTDATVVAGDKSAPARRRGEPKRKGDAIGRYVILDRLGVGGMGEVYAAFDPELDRKVAIKLLLDHRESSRDATEGAARLQREAQAMAKLVHPHVVTVHDVGLHEGQVFVAMEFVAGGDLRKWMDEGRHPWREVVTRFVQAGRGLEAAHRAGLVHRDFKPANVLLDEGGVAKVADFGLARRAEAVPTSKTTERDSVDVDFIDTLSTEITRTGAHMGTPAYMAPEQWLGEEVGPAADQFAFCVALYEALYGERPHRSDSAHAQMFQVTQGKIAEAPRGVSVPSWLRKVVVRGLAPDQERRWPDMSALLTQLERDPARRWIAAGSLVAVVAAVGITVGLATTAEPEAPKCVGFDEEFAETWSGARAAELRRGFEATGVPYADRAATSAIAALDAYAKDWVSTRKEACEQTVVRGAVPENVLARRVECLEARRRDFGALVDLLASADTKTLDRAHQLTDTLTSLDACLDTGVFGKSIPLPDDPKAAARILELDAAIDAAERQRIVADYERARELAEKAHTEALEIGYRPLNARARFTLAKIISAVDKEPDKARDLFDEAMADAYAIGDDRLFAKIASALGAQIGDYAEGHEADYLFALGFAALERAGGDQGIHGALSMNYGNALRERGELDAATRQYERARADYAAYYGPESTFVGDAEFNLGAAAFAKASYEVARTHTERALEIWKQEFGDDHPRTMRAVGSQAMFAYLQGDYDTAIAAFERQLESNERVHGANSSKVADVLSNLGGAYRYAGDHEKSVAALGRAVEIREKLLGPESVWVGHTLANLAMGQLAAGDQQQALISVDRAFSIIQAARGPEHTEMSVVHTMRGEIMLAMGNVEAAKVDFERSRALRMANGEADPTAYAELDRLMAEAHLAQGKPDLALTLIDAALSEAQKSELVDQQGLARARFVRAKVLLALGQADEARAAGEVAKKAYAGLATRLPDEEREIDAWLGNLD